MKLVATFTNGDTPHARPRFRDPEYKTPNPGEALHTATGRSLYTMIEHYLADKEAECTIKNGG